MIWKGHYPLSQHEALTLAALQIQNEFGDHDPRKHDIGYFE